MKIPSILLLLISLSAFNHQDQEIIPKSSFKSNHTYTMQVALEGGSTSFRGKLVSYLGTYNSGEFEYEEPLTGAVKRQAFEIDSKGNFEFSINLSFNLITKAWFKIGKIRTNNCYIEANKKYQLSLKRKQITFTGVDGKFNNEITQFEKALADTLGAEIKEAYSVKLLKLAFADYINPKIKVELKKSEFFQAYRKENTISEKGQKFLKNTLKYKIAREALIHAKFYGRGAKNPQDYEPLLSKFPLEASDIFEGATGLVYVTQLTIYLRNQSPKETAYTINQMLDQMKQYPPSLGRDVLITHGLHYTVYKKGLKANPEELKALQSVIQNPDIFEYVKNH